MSGHELRQSSRDRHHRSGFRRDCLGGQAPRSGHRRFHDLRARRRPGGVWRDNTYPGCACDVPSHLYSYSFAPNPNWSRTFGRQREILAYLKTVANAHGVVSRVRFNTELLEAVWDEAEKRWVVHTNSGTFTARFWRARAGCTARPSIRTSRAETASQARRFTRCIGTTSHDLTGERVAVLGTGASAVQIVPGDCAHRGATAGVSTFGAVAHAADGPKDFVGRAGAPSAVAATGTNSFAGSTTVRSRGSVWWGSWTTAFDIPMSCSVGSSCAVR